MNKNQTLILYIQIFLLNFKCCLYKLTFQNTSEEQSEPQNVLEHEEEIEQEEE